MKTIKYKQGFALVKCHKMLRCQLVQALSNHGHFLACEWPELNETSFDKNPTSTQGSIRHTSTVQQTWSLEMILQVVEFVDYHYFLLNYVSLWQNSRLVFGRLHNIVLASRMVVNQI